MLRPIRDNILASHMHRSGWPYAVRALEPLFKDDGTVIFDDFIEKTFFGKRRQINYHSGPWIGVVHHPPDTPPWYETEHIWHLKGLRNWRQSFADLRLCIALSENVSSWINDEWKVPCVTIKHPTEVPELKWSPTRFSVNSCKRLVQVGWYLRNTQSIFQVLPIPFLRRSWLRQSIPQLEINHARCGELFPERSRHSEIDVIPQVSDAEYDRYLSENVVLVELITAGANNTVVECIARGTPVVINRHPGPEYYLGSDYPLFYDRFEDIGGLLTTGRILEAHHHLITMERGWLSAESFRESVRDACLKFVPELRDY